MKILHVVRGLCNSSGTTHIVVPLAEEQARQGADVSVFFVEKDDMAPVVPDPALVESQCLALTLPMSNPGVSLPFARYVNKQIARFDIVHIHAVWNFPTFWTMRAALKAGVPYMVAPQGSFEPWALGQNAYGKKIYGFATEIPLLNKADCLQALTENEAAQFRAYGIQTPSVVIPNGIDETRFARGGPPLADWFGLPAGHKTLLFLSRLHPKKGVDVLLKAFALFAKTNDKVHLVVAGDDGGSGYGADMQTLADDLGLGQNCRFVGEVTGNGKYDLLLGADAFVLPSHSEGLPVAVVEAMASGLPVVITPGCNIPEVSAWDAGHVVAPDPGQVAAALRALFADADKAVAMGANGKRLVTANFTWTRIAQQSLFHYARICLASAAKPETAETTRAAG